MGVTREGTPTRQAALEPILDPRRGDIEDDRSSTTQRSMLALAGGLLVEVSLVKLAVAWVLLLLLPGMALGLTPIIASAWLHMVTEKIFTPFSGVLPVLVLIAILAVAWFGTRALLRMAESNFWSLTSIVVEPLYGGCRESLRHLAERFRGSTTPGQLALLLSMSAAVAGVLVCLLSVAVIWAVLPATHLFSGIREIDSVVRLVQVALANSVAMVTAYLAVGSLVWSIADATMAPPIDLSGFAAAAGDRRWRIVHLSDIHVVGERHGFRIESGRSGPRGNARLERLFSKLMDIDAENSLDAILITGDITDTGRSGEWSEFFSALNQHPQLIGRTLIIPGNHDLNIVDRANPARMDLPTSPCRRLRQLRMLSAMNAVQGTHVCVVDRIKASLSGTLAQALAPHHDAMHRFADVAKPRLTTLFSELWNGAFPMIKAPDAGNGLGIMLLNSNADTHFSFTNALGLMSAEQVQCMEIARAQYPDAYWIIALHHHVIEYPDGAKALSERIGTVLINGNWFMRRMKPFAGRAVVMHGHRHVDWIGECEGLTIVSAPSPVMEATDDLTTSFYIHTLAVDPRGKLVLMKPTRVEIPGQAAAA